VDHRLSSSDGISISGKSPLTGIIKEANAGGTTGLAITYVVINAPFHEDKPDDDEWQVKKNAESEFWK